MTPPELVTVPFAIVVTCRGIVPGLPDGPVKSDRSAAELELCIVVAWRPWALTVTPDTPLKSIVPS
jgi:hypothetical protein